MSASILFKHQPLNLDKTQIRLLRLKPGRILAGEIAIRDLKDCPEFKAVSYTWGPKYPTREISLEGQGFTVRENLWQFLNAIRDHTESWLWIDQICIDQSVVGERNHQVRLMATIYAKAAEVLIWLGTEADGSDEAMEAINFGSLSTHHCGSQAQALFQRPYWGRLWILQEILMAQNILVLCGNKSFSWKKLESLFIPRMSDAGVWTYPVRIHDIALSLIKEKASFEGADQRLSYVLETFARLRCEDIRDKVYGLLSLVRNSGAIPVDYSKTSTEVFFNAIQRIAEDESFIGFGSHFDVARDLRDRMMLVNVSDSDIFNKVEKELGKRQKISTFEKNYISQNMQNKYSQGILLSGAEEGNVEVVKLLLNKGANVDVKDNDGRTPLLWAAENRHEAVVRLLLDKGASVDAKDNNSRTPLLWAAENGYEAIMRLLLDKGANIDAKDNNGRTPLLWADRNGHEAIMRLLLDKGANIDAKDNNGWTPLLWAFQNGHEAIVRLLLDKGANVDAKDNDGRTPLLWAAEDRHEAVVRLLLDKGASVDAKDNNDRTPLLWAAKNKHEAIVRLLLDKGASVDAKDNNGQTPLLWAAENRHEAVVRLLLNKGADVGAKDEWDDRTPLSYAAENGHEAIVRLLLDKGASFDAKDEQQTRTLLSYAAENGHETIVRLLLDKGASVDGEEWQTRTPLSYAAENGHETIVRLLLDKGASVNRKEKWQTRTPLVWAFRNGHEAIVRLLVGKGAFDTRDMLEGRRRLAKHRQWLKYRDQATKELGKSMI